jgi:hypothetical protein
MHHEKVAATLIALLDERDSAVAEVERLRGFINQGPQFQEASSPEPGLREVLIHFYASHDFDRARAERYTERYISVLEERE